MDDYSEYCQQGVSCSERYIKVNESVNLRVLGFIPADHEKVPIFIIGGLATIVESFGQIIRELSRDFPVWFIETRDRKTSRITGGVSYSIETMGIDVSTVIRSVIKGEKGFVMMGYSFGSSIMVESYHLLDDKPRCLIFMEPTSVFHYPAWGLFIIRWFGAPFYRILKPFAKWYLRRFRINAIEDNEMALITFKSLDNADPHKLIKTILAIEKYQVWNKLTEIQCPSLVVGTSKDNLHVHEEVIRLVNTLQNCTYFDMENNLRTHSPELGDVVRKYINSLAE